ncbi:ABC-F family ATP-binding cassette domain-containing protein [Paenibacillus pasadenensis]|uniref:ABC-F family ATP-binding cassette domain-containing protein n=1 Tax=Paenibacillus pasadenensis TaxID=217090 RepID=UPI00203F8B8C|nr:ABC-F family ATP-binding cassette domain-containing protein [Paenibacillus pasadenensis]MCM3749114.1 ABC-F family ATP-binding cassette domain-containing protein [Paenibacillus pasadenensis]
MLLQVNDLSKSYGITAILSNISFQIQDRERVGLVGVNGAGKSTLLQILAGLMSHDGGVIHRAKETRIGYLAQNSGLQSNRSIIEEMRAVFAALIEAEQELRRLEREIADPALHEDEKRYQDTLERYARRSDWFKDQGGFEIETKIKSVLHGMGFGDTDPGTPVSSLSGGQKTRLALARILLQAPDLLMLDEPTNHLDIATLTWLEDYLRGYAGAILVVSHDRYFLDATVGTIIEIERHQAKRYAGNYSRFVDLKEAEFESAMKQFEKQQDEIARMEEFVRRNIVRASTTKRAQSRRKALDRMDRLDRPQGDLKRAHFRFEIERTTGRDVLEANDLSVGYGDNPEPVFRNASIRLERGDTAALIGPNGIGKSTLLKALIGKQSPLTGSIRWGTHVKLGYYDQEQTELSGTNTVLEEVWSAFPGVEEARIRTVLGNFLFSGDDVKKRVSSLSGGEKARVALAKLMLLQANVLILDEPTNHLDLYSKEVLESALLDYEGTLLFISHDRYFLNKIAERMIEMTSSGTVDYLGNYDDMMEKKKVMEELRLEAREAARNSASAAASANAGAAADKQAGGASSYEADKQARRDERARQRRMEQLESDITRLEELSSELELRLADPDVYQDYVQVQSVQEELSSAKALLEAAYAEWESLA